MKEALSWQRPKTTRRYLHPPKSERLFTLWAEGKILFGQVNLNGFPIGAGYEAGKYYYRALESCAVSLVCGADAQQPDFRNVKNLITEDGTPVHAVQYALGDLTLTLEGFCNTQRKATCFSKVTLHNHSSAAAEETVGLLLRSGKEVDLAYGAPNCYVSHNPQIAALKALPATWTREGDRFTDGTRVLHLCSDTVPLWNEETGLLTLPCRLAAGEALSFTFSLDMGETATYSYEEEKEKNAAFWQTELARLDKLPEKLENDPAQLKMARHLVAQLLQTFSYPIGETFLLSRQGGLMSIIWPSEALFTIEALSKAGHFGAYIEPALAAYFDVMQADSGEIINRGAYWGSVTASALYSFSVYAVTAPRTFYDAYRDKAYRAYAWIRDTRRAVTDSQAVAGGLFPPVHSNDWDQQFQGWTLTDVFNLFAMDALATAAEQFGDEIAPELRQEHDAYLADMKRHFQKYLDAADGSDELKLPLKPIGDDQYLIDGGFPLIYHGRFILCGVIEKETDIYRVYRYLVNHGIFKNGNYGHMRYKGSDHVWYFSFPDYYWFIIWMRLGQREKAQEVLNAQINYAMTDEYYMIERHDDSDPYFLPWSPNASANGRTLMMLMDMAK